MNAIWVVVRSVGEYSDRQETCVCWFPHKNSAEAFIEKATGTSRDAAVRWRKLENVLIGANYSDEQHEATYNAFMSELDLIDKGFDPTGYDADGVSYYAREVHRGELC